MKQSIAVHGLVMQRREIGVRCVICADYSGAIGTNGVLLLRFSWFTGVLGVFCIDYKVQSNPDLGF